MLITLSGYEVVDSKQVMLSSDLFVSRKQG